MVDNFVVKNIDKEHVLHFLQVLKQAYEVKEDWEGTRYLGMTIDWDYKKRDVHLSMPGYVEKALARSGHLQPKYPQHQYTNTQFPPTEQPYSMPRQRTQ